MWQEVSGEDIRAEKSVPSGAEVMLRLSGFKPHSLVRLELHSEPVYLGTVLADLAGIVDARFQLPDHAEPGLHAVHAIGLDRNGEVLRMQLPVRIADVRPGQSLWIPVLPVIVMAIILIWALRKRDDDDDVPLLALAGSDINRRDDYIDPVSVS